MKMTTILVTAASIFTCATTALAAAAEDAKVAESLTAAMEKFYGQPIGAADSYLAQHYGTKGPIKQEGSSYVYMVPAGQSMCGELTLDVTNEGISSWQTITWQRTEDHQRGRACDQAFKEKLGSL